jgi:hypothetical protein
MMLGTPQKLQRCTRTARFTSSANKDRAKKSQVGRFVAQLAQHLRAPLHPLHQRRFHLASSRLHKTSQFSVNLTST